MSPAELFVAVVSGLAALGFGPLLRPMWRIARNDPSQRVGFWALAAQVTLAASVPVAVFGTGGHAGLYPGIAAVAVLAIGVGLVIARRKLVARAMRTTKTGGP